MGPIIVIFVAAAVVLFFLLKSKVAKVLVSAFVIVVGVVLMMQDSTINQKQEQNVVKSENKLEGENDESGQNNSDSKDSTQESNNDKSDEKKEDKEASNKDNSQSTQNNSTYLQELASLEAKTNNMLDGYTTYEMTNSATQIYTLWDNELNKIYGVLKNQLSESEMNSLRQKQREWITYRDNKAEQDAAEYEGGTMAQLELILSKANTTQERCYELVNWYMK